MKTAVENMKRALEKLELTHCKSMGDLYGSYACDIGSVHVYDDYHISEFHAMWKNSLLAKTTHERLKASLTPKEILRKDRPNWSMTYVIEGVNVMVDALCISVYVRYHEVVKREELT